MIEELERLVDEICDFQSKLILLVGPPRSGKSSLLRTLSDSRDVSILNVGSALTSRLAGFSHNQRQLMSSEILRALADEYSKDDLLLIDNIEALFDHSLQLNPLGLLKKHAHARRVVAVWPGDLHGRRLRYAAMGHPEWQDYGLESVTIFEVQKAGKGTDKCDTVI